MAAIPAQEQRASTRASSQQAGGTAADPHRLEAIERSLEALLKEVQALRQPGGGPAAPAAERAVAPASGASARPPENWEVQAEWLKNLNWRSIGPANMGGRITSIAVNERDPSMWWIATASGGLLKTINNGVTMEHQFDHEATVSIGAVAVAPSDANIVWVGTGEANPRNSVSYGDGVYRSTDGGKTWKNMGLKKIYQTGGLVIHPRDPNTVYVGALGRLYGPSEDRGVYKTTDGGQTWQKVFYVDDRTGVIDLIMHPADPETLIAAMWDRQRDGFDSWPGDVPKPDGIDGYDPIRKWGPGGGLYKTTDGGKTWKKLKDGLPTNHTGRIGIDWHRQDPKIVYAIIDCQEIGKGPPPLPVYLGAVGADVDGQARITQILPDSPAAKAGLAVGDTLTAIGDKEISGFDELLDVLREKKPRDKVTLAVTRGGEKKSLEATLTTRPPAGGTTPAAAASRVWLGVTGADREGKATITQVIAGGPAAKAGLKEGDAIVAIDGQEINDYDKLLELVRGKEAGDKATLKISRGNETLEVAVTLEDRPATTGARGGGAPAAPTTQPPSDVYLGIQGTDGPMGGAPADADHRRRPGPKSGSGRERRHSGNRRAEAGKL